jgi:hypothetical protein
MNKLCEICNKEFDNDSEDTSLHQVRLPIYEGYRYYHVGCINKAIYSVKEEIK